MREFTYEVRVIDYPNGNGSYGEPFGTEIEPGATSEVITGTGRIEIVPFGADWECESCGAPLLAGRPYARIDGSAHNGNITIDECCECFVTGDSFGQIVISAES